MFPHQEHVWIIGCIFNTPCPTYAFSMHWSYIAYCHLLHTPLLSLSCIGLYLVFSSQHVMFTLHFVASCYVLCFELHFPIHLAPLMHHSPYSFLHLLPSFLLDPFVYSCKKGGEYTLECIPESFVISIWLLCTSLEGEILFLMHIWCMIKFLICVTLCLLDRNLLVSLYLSFYYLLYLEGLICFV